MAQTLRLCQPIDSENEILRMKIVKIVLGFLLLLGAGKETVIAAKQLGTFLDPGVLVGVLVLLLLCTWLIGSGFSKDRFKFQSMEFVKYFVICSVLFALIVIVCSK